MFSFFKKLFSSDLKKNSTHMTVSVTASISPCNKLNKIIENDSNTEKIIDDFEYRKNTKRKEIRRRFNKESPENDVLWDIFQDLYLESFLKDHHLLLNVEYQRRLLLQKEKLYKDAVSHFAYGLFYLLNFYGYSFDPSNFKKCIDGREVYHAQEKFSNKLAICVRKGKMDEETFFDSAKHLIISHDIDWNISLNSFLQDIFIYLKDDFRRNNEAEIDYIESMSTINDYAKQSNIKDIETIGENDHLSLAANAGYRAKLAMKDKDYEKAWSLFTEQKNQFIKSVEERGYPASEAQALKQIVALEALVHEDFANILRLEKKHKKALISMIYCVAGEYPGVKYKAKKLPAYFKRAKLNNVTFEEMENFIYSIQHSPNYEKIKDKVQEWDNKKDDYVSSSNFRG